MTTTHDKAETEAKPETKAEKPVVQASPPGTVAMKALSFTVYLKSGAQAGNMLGDRVVIFAEDASQARALIDTIYGDDLQSATAGAVLAEGFAPSGSGAAKTAKPVEPAHDTHADTSKTKKNG